MIVLSEMNYMAHLLAKTYKGGNLKKRLRNREEIQVINVTRLGVRFLL